MASITAIAHDFFAACETGKGWDVCKAYYVMQFTGDKISHMKKFGTPAWH